MDKRYQRIEQPKVISIKDLITVTDDYAPKYGSILHIYGEVNSGKTYLTTQIARRAEKDGMTVIYFPSKASIPYKLVWDINRFLIVKTLSIEAIFESIKELIEATNFEIPYLFIIDDLSMMKSIKETELDKSTVANYLSIFSQLVRQTRTLILNSNSILICISQMRTQISTSRQVSQLNYINDISDTIYKVQVAEKHSKYNLVGVNIIDKIENNNITGYFSINKENI